MKGDFLRKKETTQGIETGVSQTTEQRCTNRRNSWRKSMLTATNLYPSQRRNTALWKANLGIRQCQKRLNYPKESKNTGEGMSRPDWPSYCSKRCTTQKEIQVYFYASLCFPITKGEMHKGRKDHWGCEDSSKVLLLSKLQAAVKCHHQPGIFLIDSEYIHFETHYRDRDSRV